MASAAEGSECKGEVREMGDKELRAGAGVGAGEDEAREILRGRGTARVGSSGDGTLGNGSASEEGETASEEATVGGEEAGAEADTAPRAAGEATLGFGDSGGAREAARGKGELGTNGASAGTCTSLGIEVGSIIKQIEAAFCVRHGTSEHTATNAKDHKIAAAWWWRR